MADLLKGGMFNAERASSLSDRPRHSETATRSAPSRQSTLLRSRDSAFSKGISLASPFRSIFFALAIHQSPLS